MPTDDATVPSPKPPLPALWFGSAPVSRSVYARTGFSLIIVKYAVEACSLFVLFGVLFDPWMFLFPSLDGRRDLLGEHAGSVAIAWTVWTIPFVWIAFSMTLRRAMDAGRSPWWSVAIFVPGLNIVAMLAFLVPGTRTSRRHPCGPRDKGDDGEQVVEDSPPNFYRFILAFALCVTVAGGMLALAVYGVQDYAAALFFGTPLVMGMVVSVFTYDRRDRNPSHLARAGLALVLAFGLLIMVGFEGVICMMMSFPISLLLAFVGAILGKAIVESGAYPGRHVGIAAVALPIWLLVESATHDDPTLSVTTSIEIDAPIERVWENVIHFPELPDPEEWYFKMGIACPTRARIEGSGVGAVRHCIFTTGTFVEPITAWEEPTRLAFDVREQPAPMFELSPYRDLHPPHLDGTLRSVRGEFRLERIEGGRTRLIGTTWYQFDMHPRQYWVLWSDWLIHAIHRRVLRHIKKCVE